MTILENMLKVHTDPSALHPPVEYFKHKLTSIAARLLASTINNFKNSDDNSTASFEYFCSGWRSWRCCFVRLGGIFTSFWRTLAAPTLLVMGMTDRGTTTDLFLLYNIIAGALWGIASADGLSWLLCFSYFLPKFLDCARWGSTPSKNHNHTNDDDDAELEWNNNNT